MDDVRHPIQPQVIVVVHQNVAETHQWSVFLRAVEHPELLTGDQRRSGGGGGRASLEGEHPLTNIDEHLDGNLQVALHRPPHQTFRLQTAGLPR